ncbi:MAG TPA: VOC family protein [Burkholderiaceae bacterium]|nr:VOC family protein [Burkholderiaceae bacterium]
MHKQIYVNLAVKDLKRSIAFFEGLGFTFNPQFTNEQGACMVISDDIYAMLLDTAFFKTFTPKAVCDTKTHVETLLCLSCDSRAEVDDLVKKAVAGGGSVPRAPQDHGFMYHHAFEDVDGHTWELMHMSSTPPAA